MNQHNMNCFLDNMQQGRYQELVVEYDCGVINRAVMHGDSGLITFYYRDGIQHQVDVSAYMKADFVFAWQYGIGITEDGKYFFVPRWESGLYCFELETGKMVWKSKRRHPQSYVVREDNIVCLFESHGLDILSIKDGTSLKYCPYGGASSFFALTDALLLVGEKRGKYHLFDEQLNVIQSIPSRVLNPVGYDSFILLDACIEGDYVRLSGFEGWREELFRADREGRSNEYTESCRFVRCIPICKTKDGTYLLGEGGAT